MAAEQISAVGLPHGTDLAHIDGDYFQSRRPIKEDDRLGSSFGYVSV
jgi:hypothetical protein